MLLDQRATTLFFSQIPCLISSHMFILVCLPHQICNALNFICMTWVGSGKMRAKWCSKYLFPVIVLQLSDKVHHLFSMSASSHGAPWIPHVLNISYGTQLFFVPKLVKTWLPVHTQLCKSFFPFFSLLFCFQFMMCVFFLCYCVHMHTWVLLVTISLDHFKFVWLWYCMHMCT
jgi:hypothetical protein